MKQITWQNDHEKNERNDYNCFELITKKNMMKECKNGVKKLKRKRSNKKKSQNLKEENRKEIRKKRVNEYRGEKGLSNQEAENRQE